MSGASELEERITVMQEASETLRMDIQLAQETTVRLRAAHKELKQLIDTELPRIVSEAVAHYIHNDRRLNDSTRDRQ